MIEGADQISVRLYDTREFPAKVIGYDVGTDLALLKIQEDNLSLAYFDLDYKDLSMAKPGLEVGQWVVAIGSPFGFDHTVTKGIVSALGRTFTGERYVPFIQSDVSINPGNSGGPLLNLSGDLVGINSQIVSDTGNYSGLSFSIPTKVIKVVYHELMEHGSVKRPWLGLVFQDLDRNLAESFGLDKVKGALISKVIGNSPAQRAGLKEGDIILKVNAQEVVSATDISPIIGLLEIDSMVPVQVMRDGKVKELTIQLLTAPQIAKKVDKATTPVNFIDNALEFPFGIKISETATSNDGVIVEELQGSAWKNAAVQLKDVIVSVNGVPVKTSKAFYEVLKTLPKAQPFHILVMRPADTQVFLSVLLP